MVTLFHIKMIYKHFLIKTEMNHFQTQLNLFKGMFWLARGIIVLEGKEYILNCFPKEA